MDCIKINKIFCVVGTKMSLNSILVVTILDHMIIKVDFDIHKRLHFDSSVLDVSCMKQLLTSSFVCVSRTILT